MNISMDFPAPVSQVLGDAPLAAKTWILFFEHFSKEIFFLFLYLLDGTLCDVSLRQEAVCLNRLVWKMHVKIARSPHV